MHHRLESVLGEKYPRWALMAAALAVLAFAVTLCWRGIILSDEGYLLLQALDLRDGKVLYRDMDAFVTPGVWLLLAGLFSVVEPSVSATRFLALGCLLATIAASYVVVGRLAGRASALASVGAFVVFTVWAFPAWTFSFYSPFSVMFALWGLERLLAWSQSQRGRDLFWVGALIGLSISFKQNYGVYALFGTLVGIVAIYRETGEAFGGCLRRTAHSSIQVGLGLAVIGLPLLVYFTYQGALPDLIDSLVVRPFVFAGLHDIAYPAFSKLWDPTFLGTMVTQLTYGAHSLYQTAPPFGLMSLLPVAERLNLFLYWAPPILVAVGLFLSIFPSRAASRVDGQLFSVVAMAGFVFLGVFPRADFNHFINVFQPMVILGALVIQRLLARYPSPRSQLVKIGIGFGASILVLYTVVAGSWYVSLLRLMSDEVNAPRGGVLLSPLAAQKLGFQVKRIQSITSPGEPVLTVPDLAMLNFLAERPMPSRYYNLYQHHINRDEGAGVVEASEKNGVRVAVARMANFFSDRTGLRDYAPKLSNYLKTHFDPTFQMSRDGFLFLERRKTPRPLLETLDVLADCEELDPTVYGGQISRKHLLFDSLYLYPGTTGDQKTAEARCRVTVPKNAELAMRIGFVPPPKVEPGTWLIAEILASYNGRREQLLTTSFEVTPAGFMEWGNPPDEEFRVDLSHLAGKEVSLIFRTTRSGTIRLGVFLRGGFSMAWGDIRIEHAGEAR